MAGYFDVSSLSLACLMCNNVTAGRRYASESSDHFEKRSLGKFYSVDAYAENVCSKSFGFGMGVADDNIRRDVWRAVDTTYQVVKSGRLIRCYGIPTVDRKIKHRVSSCRGAVSKVFSFRSQRGLKNSLCSFPLDNYLGKMYELTLTFPDDVEVRTGQNCLRTFAQFLKRHYHFFGWWKKEFTERGRLHYHLLLLHDVGFSLGRYRYVNQDLSSSIIDRYDHSRKGTGLAVELQQKWFETVCFIDDFKSISFFNAGLEISVVKDSNAIGCYFASYITGTKGKKLAQNICPASIPSPGRWWGYVDREKVVQETERVFISFQQYCEIQKQFSSYITKHSPKSCDKTFAILYLTDGSQKDRANEILNFVDKIIRDNKIEDEEMEGYCVLKGWNIGVDKLRDDAVYQMNWVYAGIVSHKIPFRFPHVVEKYWFEKEENMSNC